MYNVFKGALIALSRNRKLYLWTLAFPLVLATMFMLLFSNLESETSFSPVPTAIVADANYDHAPAFAKTIDEIGRAGNDQLLDIHRFKNAEAARSALTSGEVDGVIAVDATGTPTLAVTPAFDGAGVKQINQTILNDFVDTYIHSDRLVADIAASNPLALKNPDRVGQALERSKAVKEVSLTHSAPSMSVRFYYALLGMVALFCAQIGIFSISETQPNLSALGARRALGTTSRAATLAATLAASWAISFACLIAVFLYIRLVAGIDFGGRELICVAALAIAALFSTAFGTLLGSLPKLSWSMKAGLLAGITCTLSFFAGLYGQPSLQLADSIARSHPVLASLNPSKVISDLFYALYYYDSLTPFIEKAGVLLAMGAVVFALSTLFIRRQRYASI